MKRLKATFLVSLFLFGFSSVLFAQVNNDDILLTISGKKITVGEFMSIYQKNNTKTENIDKKNLEDYLELYINFKLKVQEAEDLKLDTLSSFITELKGYRDQLAKPYFTDETTINRLVEEAYNREQQDLRASHIFMRLKPDATPDDTLATYDKMLRIRERLLNGESFGNLANELSEDPSARDRQATAQRPFIRGNHGDLGYFTVFDMVYPFESAAYNLEVGKISMPVRTDYGFHLIQLSDRKNALGKITVAHIFMMIPKDSTGNSSKKVEMKMDSVYQMLKNGGNWDELVKQYSEDKGSASKGGLLPEFGVNRMVPEFIEQVYNLKNKGDYSAPFQTPYGWHIVKLIDRKAPGSFDEEKASIKQHVMKDSRAILAKEAVIERVKSENNFVEYPDAKTDFYKVVTDTIFEGKWDKGVAKDLNKPLFKINAMVYKQPEFARYLSIHQKKREKETIPAFVDQSYKEFVDDILMKIEDGNLEKKYPEFRNLMTEYRDGILLFDLTDQKVWSKAVKDTVGLKNFYEQNKNSYMWGPRVEATIFTVKNAAQAQKVRNFLKTGLKEEGILKEMNTDSLKVITFETGKYSRKDNKYVDEVSWVPGISNDIRIDSGIIIVNIKKVLNPEPKSLNEARGLITSDYQNYLEKAWIQKLRDKYPVVVNKNVLAKLK
ncbi:MAG: peptidylprolyl isomerase [Bacteroidota bacterium]|nr:peptidylprolyl isomerase [Bacteroidota bacterium]